MCRLELQRNTQIWYEGDHLSLHLGSDSNVRMMTHANELFARMGLTLFIWIVISIPWLMNIDNLLEYFVKTLDPCMNNCLNLYEPERWSELRWLIAGLFGLITILPLVNWQIWRFSKPGLTYREQKSLKIALLLCPTVLIFSAYFSIIELLPFVYEVGHDVHLDYGFEAKYDAINLVYFATTVLWIEFLVIISCSIMISGSLTGSIDVKNANCWRLRVYGFIALLSLLSFYERTSYGLLITLLTITMIESVSRPWINRPAKYNVVLDKRYSSSGEVISSLNVVCGCITGKMPTNENYLTIKDICDDRILQDDLIQIILNHKPKRVNSFCCDNEKFWMELQRLQPTIDVYPIQND